MTDSKAGKNTSNETAKIDLADPALQARAEAIWRALSPEDHILLSIALQRYEVMMNGGDIELQELRDRTSGKMTAKVAELAADHLQVERRDKEKAPPAITGMNVKTWLSQRFFGDAAAGVMEYAALEVEVDALKQAYGTTKAKQDADAVIKKLTPHDLGTLLDPVENIYSQQWRPENEEDKTRLKTQAMRVLHHTVTKAVCEGQDLGNTSAEVAQNIVPRLLSNETERQTLLKKLEFNHMMRVVAGGREPTLGDAASVIRQMQGFAADPRNAPGRIAGRVRD